MIVVTVERANALEFSADVLVLKYAQLHYGVDAVAADLFARAGQELRFPVPMRDARLMNSPAGISARQVLFVGVPPLTKLGYGEIREFARKALAALATEAPEARHIALTLHGPGYGLDELEAFESEIGGLSDAAREGCFPQDLTAITFVEWNAGRVSRLAERLKDLLPNGSLGARQRGGEPMEETRKQFANVGNSSNKKPHVFVAMPFKEEMDDVYHFGIQAAVREAGYLCERADLSSFTGDVMDWVRERIRSASFVVADLTEASPSVYLEVGYAWGVGVPTVLVVRDAAHLKFDVKTQRCLVYKKIRDLESLLSAELRILTKASTPVTAKGALQ